MGRDQVKTQVLLLHGEQSTLDTLSSEFNDRYTVHCATSGTEALNTLGDTPIHVIVSAQDLPGMSGVEALREAKKRSPDTIGILLAGENDRGLEALVSDKEVFQIVLGGISNQEIAKLVDNATQQMRLLALAESANDTAANPDEPYAEHIVMETSENGSTIISDGTGTVPILDPKKISAAGAIGANTVDVLVLTKDDEFLATVRESSRGMHNIRYANTLAKAEEALVKYKIGVAVVDAAMVGGNVEKLTEHLLSKSSRLVSIVAGRRDDGEMLMDLINRGKVYRFLLKPVSPGRARLAVEASVKHHLEAPDSAFKAKGSAAKRKPKPAPAPKAAAKPKPKPAPAPKAAAKARPKPAPAPKVAAKPKPKPAPAAKARPAAKSNPAPAPKAAAKPKPKRAVRPQIEITPSPEHDRLGGVFGADNSSFTKTMGGVVANIGEKIRKREAKKTAKPAPAPIQIPTASTDSTGGSPFTRPKTLGIGAVAIVALVSVGFWMFNESDERAPTENTAATDNAANASNPAVDTTTTDDTPVDAVMAADKAAQEIDLVIAAAEAALLDRRSDVAAAELAKLSQADRDNARLPFLMAQVSQMQLREYLDSARTAIRETRLEDAASALSSARALDIADTTEIDNVASELLAARSALRVEDLLAKAADRLEQGKLLSPANDNAGYFYELALSADPNNAAAQQGPVVIASKLVLKARAEIDGGRFDSANSLLGDARRLDPNSDELSSASRALADAEKRVVEEDGRVKAAAAQRAEAQRVAEAKRIADARLAAERKAEAERVAEAKRIEDARLAAERKAEAERVAEAKRIEEDRRVKAAAAAAALAASQRAEAERVVEAKRIEDERFTAQRQAAADRQAEIERQAEAERVAEAKRIEDERLAAELQAEADRQAEIERQAAADRQAEIDRQAAADKRAEDERLALAAAAAADAGASGSTNVVNQPAQRFRENPVPISTLTRITYVAPKYPRAAERRNLSGWVDIVFTVATDGTTKDIEIRDSQPDQTFVRAATKAVQRWVFMPVFDNGMVVEQRAGVRMMFALE